MRIVEPIHKARAVPVLFRTLILVFLGMVPAAVSATDELSVSILPVLARHCIGCHSGAAAKGGLNLATDASAALAPAMSDIARLDIIADRLGSHRCGQSQPSQLRLESKAALHCQISAMARLMCK